MSEDMGEDTRIAVGNLLKKSRRKRVPVLIGGVFTAGFIVFMALQFGTQRKAELTVDGPVYPGKTMSAPVAEPPVTPRGKTVSPTSEVPSATVEVIIVGKNPQLWVDGHPQEPHKRHNLLLSAGKHVLMLQQGTRTVAQKIFLDTGENYRVEFRDKVVVTKLP